MSTEEKKIIAFVMYPGLTALDLIGPLSALSGLGDPYQSIVVGETTEAVPVQGGTIKFGAVKTFDEVPNPFGIIVPGGGMPTVRAMANARIHKYLKSNVDSAEFIGSVCTGALILAAAGLLEGRKATTHWGWRPELEKFGATYVKQRWVEDGKYITAAGVSAGIDMGLYLASRLKDEKTARLIQRGIEYDPEPPFGGIDWTGTEELIIDPKDFQDDQRQAFQEALAEMPEIFERLMK